MSSPSREPKGSALVLYYLLQFSTIGILLPFLPQYLKSLGFSGTEVGVLLALGPTLSLVSPPLWGQLADRSGRPGRVLFATTAGSTALFSLLLFVRGFGGAFAVLLAYYVFNTAIVTVIDTMALKHVARSGGTYARLRLFGSLGFSVASMVFGRLVTGIDSHVISVSLVLMVIASAWTLFALGSATSTQATGPKPTMKAALALTQDPELRLFLVAVALHWLACGPYHSALSIHVTALHLPPSVVGDTATLGVIAEVVVMTTWPRWGHLVKPHRLLALSFAVTGARWLAMAFTSSGTVIIALAVIHGLTFGAFYLSSVAFVAQRVPESLRATGQALFATAVYGVGGLAGFLATGIGIDLTSSHAVFGAAGVLELVPAVLILQLPKLRARQAVLLDVPAAVEVQRERA